MGHSPWGRKESDRTERLHFGVHWTSQVALMVTNPHADAGDMRHSFDPWVRKIPWRRAWQPTPGFLPREAHEHRRLVGYSLCLKESDSTEVTEHTVYIRCIPATYLLTERLYPLTNLSPFSHPSASATTILLIVLMSLMFLDSAYQ